ncbi:MAG: hypothetical protein ACJ8F7_07530 [Gemmataceae bacterium]
MFRTQAAGAAPLFLRKSDPAPRSSANRKESAMSATQPPQPPATSNPAQHVAPKHLPQPRKPEAADKSKSEEFCDEAMQRWLDLNA